MSLKFTMSADATPIQVRDAIKAEVERRIAQTKIEAVRFKTKADQANNRGQLNALSGVLLLLENLEFTA